MYAHAPSYRCLAVVKLQKSDEECAEMCEMSLATKGRDTVFVGVAEAGLIPDMWM